MAMKQPIASRSPYIALGAGVVLLAGAGAYNRLFTGETLEEQESLIEEAQKLQSVPDFGPASCVALGDKITGTPAAKAIFKTGLGYMLNYNHEMAIGTFQEALKADPDCAMAWWGIAYALSSNYNWPPGLGSGFDAIQAAVALKSKVSELERDLIDALTTRHSAEAKAGADPTKLMMGNDPALNGKFADAMEKVYKKYPSDLDVAAIYAEALMNLKPWALWTGHADGRAAIKPADDNTLTAIKVIEDAFELEGGKTHPALCHLYCHALELSPFPEKALPAADTLRKLMPDAGHLVHMPSHIDAWVGQWKEGVDCNMDAVAADDRFVEANAAMESCFYKFYRMHNIHFVVWCAMHTGQYKVAMEYARKAEACLPAGDQDSGVSFMLAGIIPMGAIFLESYRTMVWHVMVRFGKWGDILAEPIDAILAQQDVFPASVATAHYARGLAHAAKGDVAAAEAEERAFLAALENPNLAGRVQHNNLMYDGASGEGKGLLNVSKAMLRGEIEYRKAVIAKEKASSGADSGASFDRAFASLREAVDLSLNLKYNEPWGQMQPIRHALGALLLEQGRVDEAADAFRADLGMWRGNMWGLLGLKQCLEAQKAAGWSGAAFDAELAQVAKEFAEAADRADEVPAATCFCAQQAGATNMAAGCGTVATSPGSSCGCGC